MAWETRKGGGRYYTRTRQVNGRQIREYIGCGPLADLLAEHDRFEQIQREAEWRRLREEKAQDRELFQEVDELDAITKTLMKKALETAGFHQHHGSEWRKRSGKKEEARGGKKPGIHTPPDSGGG